MMSTVFSIIFEKPFVTITPEIASSRISSILNLLGIGERNLNKCEDISVIETPIDYRTVKKKLAEEQKKSMDYLRNATKSISEFTHNK